NILLIAPVAQVADPVPLVSDELVVPDKDPSHPGAEIKPIAEVAAGFVVGELGVRLPAARVITWPATALHKAPGHEVAAALLHADPVGRPLLDPAPLDSPVRHFQKVDSGEGKSQLGRRPFRAGAYQCRSRIRFRLTVNGQVLDHHAIQALSGDGREVVDD